MFHRPCSGLPALLLSVALLASTASVARAADKSTPGLGNNAPLNGWRPMSDASEWNRPIGDDAVDANSRWLLGAIRHTSGPFVGHAWLHPDFGPDSGIPYLVVDRAPATHISFESDESDKGEYAVPLDAPVEPGSDRHVLVVDRGRNKLFELFAAHVERQAWRAGSGAVFDLAGDDRQRPDGWTSADAAGLPIFPGLAKYDEVASGEIRHALRFTAPKTRRACLFPASHYASQDKDAGLPPMGMRIRLKKSFDTRPYAPAARTILKCLQTYGAILADNGGPFFISGAPSPKWETEDLAQIKRIRDELLLDSLEVVRIDPQRLTVGR